MKILFKHLKTIAASCLSLFALNCIAVDAHTAAFIANNSKKLAIQKKYDESLAEIAWLLKDSSPSIRKYAEEVLIKYPAVADARLDALTTSRLTDMTYQDALALVDEVARFASARKLSDVHSRLKLAYENENITDHLLKYKQTHELLRIETQKEQSELVDAATKNAPAKLRVLDLSDFCVEYGLSLRGLTSDAYSMARDPTKLFDAEAKRRRVSIDKKLVKSEQIRVGINLCTLYASWGRPNSQNRTVGSWGVHIQHVYANFGPLVYTENGRVTSWQD